MNMATTTEGPLFDRIIAQSQSRSRSGSANSASLNGSLPPPPRRRKPQPPAALSTSSLASLPMRRPPMAAPATQIAEASDVNPFRNPFLVDAESLRRPNPFAVYDESGQHAHKYADSLSSLNSYSNLFYKPEDEASSSPITRPADDPPTMDQTNFDDAASVEDYSDLLYPELHSPVGPSKSPRDSIDMHGPPIRKRMPSFASQASHNGPESPVEFAYIGTLSLPPPVPVLEEYRPSKVDRLLGIDSQSSSGSTDRLLTDQARRESFMEFDIQAFGAKPDPNAGATRRSQSSISDEMPTFAPRDIRSVMASQPNNSIEGYKALVESVDHAGTDVSPKLDSRQILVDGSDKQQWSTPPNHGGKSSSASSPPPEARLSTTNFLDKKERADAVRKNRKILQVLGPGVVPSAQGFVRTGRTTPTPDTPEIRHDPLHRATRSYSLVDGEVGSNALYKTRVRELTSHRPPNLQAKSSWNALDQDTIYLSASGRRHSSPLSPTFDPSSVSRRVDSDSVSLSSLGSIIVGLGRIGDKNDARSGSPGSFMEMSDDEGARTPKRRPSIESVEREVPIRQRTERAASLNDLLTISGALESTRRVSVPDTPIIDYSSSIPSGNSSRPIRDMTFQSSLYRGSNFSDEYGVVNVEGDEAELERQRKRQKLAKIHRYLGSKVPPELVLGYSSSSPSFAIPTVVLPAQHLTPDNRDQEVKKRRRSSSAVIYQHTHGLDPLRRSDAENRAQDTFTDVERMMRIKRAQKIEQIFGESPSRPTSISGPPRPSTAQGLSRNQSAAPKTPLKRTTVATPTPEHPQNERGFKPRSPFVSKDGRRLSTSGSSRPSTAQSTTGLMSSYQKDVERDKKPRGTHHQAHSAEISNTSAHFPVGIALGSPGDLYGNAVLDISANAMAGYGSKSPVMPSVHTSRQFVNYRNSLNSLSRILDHDDRQSLNDLHAVLDSDEEENGDPDLQSSALVSGSIDTQRMLQPRASIASINSVATTSTYATLTPDPMAFQARRKRAAKLAQFFGASYRDLFGEVLVRIERGMLEEARAGQISEEEVKHLMKQLTRLKSRQSQLS